MWSRMYPGCDPCDECFFCRSTTSHENKVVIWQMQEEVLCDWVSSKFFGVHICCILFVLLSPAILLQSIEALGLKAFFPKGHRGILKRYCQRAQSPKCLQSHLVYQSITYAYLCYILLYIVFWSTIFFLYNIYNLEVNHFCASTLEFLECDVGKTGRKYMKVLEQA